MPVRFASFPRRAWLTTLALAMLTVLPFACGGKVNVAKPPAVAPLPPARAAASWDDARAVFESRCVLCHGCYDAPCQLKLGTFEGIERGASDARVYDPSRLVAADPTRLGVDAHGPAAWREKSFHPVLPEGTQTDPRASVLLRMLALKKEHPLPAASAMEKSFTLDLDRKESCTTASDFDGYAKDHPLWGMPYALPALAEAEETKLVTWVNAGAPRPAPVATSEPLAQSIAAWESFLDEPSNKGQLVARYVYEHLFLASITFADVDAAGGAGARFRLVRSRTPSGTPVDEIATRRPFDDPGLGADSRVHYRFVRREETPLEKTSMPYPLSAARLEAYRALFMAPRYEVPALPGYEPEVAANPFRAFQALPVKARYRFMLEEAQFTMMGFIKGPVCRGQVALNVIEDRFWIAFFDPDVPWAEEEATFLASVKQDLDMPAEGGSTAMPTLWVGYGKEHARYVDRKIAFFDKVTREGKGLNLGLIWDGDAHPGRTPAGGNAAESSDAKNARNDNAALTVVRHFDSATVEKGFVGERPPKTGWVVGYPLLERIHYLLVAGFDVYGNVTHQLATRLYMDFLRMEGESNYLLFLPPDRRRALVDRWYRGVDGSAKARVTRELAGFTGKPAIHYGVQRGASPETELFTRLAERTGAAQSTHFSLGEEPDEAVRRALVRLAAVQGRAAAAMPEMAFLRVHGPDDRASYATMLRDSGHTNVAHLFGEQARRLPDEDELTVVHGFLGAYPNAIFDVAAAELEAFVDGVGALDGDEAYRRLRLRFGLLRTSDRFWAVSDALAEAHRKDGADAGLFDFNRLEAF